MPSVSLNALLIKMFDFKDADRIYVFLTADYGKISAIGKSVRKPKSKKTGILQILNFVDISINKGKTLNLIQEVKLIKSIKNEKLIKNFSLIHYITEIINKTTNENEESLEYFSYLKNFISFFNETDFSSIYYQIIFSYQILEILGWGFSFKSCLKCENLIKEEINFIDSISNGLICPKCNNDKYRKLPIEGIKILKLFQKMNFNILKLLNEPKKEIVEILKEEIDNSISYHLDIKLKSLKFSNLKCN
jgi:DNA repair protein RecO (recombination protein O)